MWFIPAIVAAAVARKIVARYWHGVAAQHARVDPPGLRTVARFTTSSPRRVLAAIAEELTKDLGALELLPDAIRADADGTRIDIVRLARRDGMWTVELTRAWTGAHLGEHARYLLSRIHVALLASAEDVVWFARQDRELAEGFAIPFDLAPAVV